VQLVPGTEIVVAPKTRFKPPPKPNPQIEQTKSKALLRVQAGYNKHVHQFNYRGVELGVALTSCVFIHPETALNIGFGNLEFGVVSPKVVPKEGSKNGNGEVSVTKKVLNSNLNSRERNRHIVMRVIYSNSVAKGHLMLPQPVRHYIRADVHECEFEILIQDYFYLLSLFLILSPSFIMIRCFFRVWISTDASTCTTLLYLSLSLLFLVLYQIETLLLALKP
jgi:hypothetical protein